MKHRHQCILSKGRFFTANSDTKAAVLPKAGFPAQNSETKAAVLQRLNRCGSFPLFSAPHSLFCIWTDLKRSEKIPGARTWRWGELIWLTGPSGLYRNSPQCVKYLYRQGSWPVFKHNKVISLVSWSVCQLNRVCELTTHPTSRYIMGTFPDKPL